MKNKISKIRLIGNVKIIETPIEKRVVKAKTKDLEPLFEYLKERGLDITPQILESTNTEITYKYYEENKTFQIDKSYDLIKLVSTLHYKTAYYKPVSRKKYKDIYNTLIDNVDYLKEYYNDLITKIDNTLFMSPSEYLLARNYTIINTSLIYIEKELNAWYNLVKDKTKERVSIVHNNLKLNNYIKGEKEVLTSWDNFLVDTPILDLYKLYKNEYKNIDFASLLKEYNNTFKLTKEEVKLLFILISMPIKLESTKDEYETVREVKRALDYIYRTNKVITSSIFN